MSKLSIIVATYRMQREAPRTIRSLLPPLQRCVDDLDYEIIVVDNGSPELLVGIAPLSLAVRRPVPGRTVSFEQGVVQLPDRFVLLVALPVEWRLVVDFTQGQPRGLQTAGQQGGSAPVHAQNDHARGLRQQ